MCAIDTAFHRQCVMNALADPLSSTPMLTPPAPSLSIIIPVLNEAARVEAALQRLRAQAPEAEIVVVGGGSRDDTAAGWPDPCS